MANVNTDQLLENNQQYASGQQVHQSSHPGKQPINRIKGVSFDFLFIMIFALP